MARRKKTNRPPPPERQSGLQKHVARTQGPPATRAATKRPHEPSSSESDGQECPSCDNWFTNDESSDSEVAAHNIAVEAIEAEERNAMRKRKKQRIRALKKEEKKAKRNRPQHRGEKEKAQSLAEDLMACDKFCQLALNKSPGFGSSLLN